MFLYIQYIEYKVSQNKIIYTSWLSHISLLRLVTVFIKFPIVLPSEASETVYTKWMVLASHLILNNSSLEFIERRQEGLSSFERSGRLPVSCQKLASFHSWYWIMAWLVKEGTSRGSHTCYCHHKWSLESQAILSVYRVIALPKVGGVSWLNHLGVNGPPPGSSFRFIYNITSCNVCGFIWRHTSVA